MQTALILIGIFLYLFVGGVVGRMQYNRDLKNCKYFKHPEAHYVSCDGPIDHPLGVILGLAWPVAIPALAGAACAQWVEGREDREARREKRKQAEEQRKEAEHQRTMAELKARRETTMESIKFLVENGIKADVPGLFDGGES